MEKQKNPLIDIVAITLGILMVVVVMFLIFAKESLQTLVPISWAFIVLGIIVALLQVRLMKGDVKKK